MNGLRFGNLWGRVDAIGTWIRIKVTKVIDIHLDEERGELPEKAFVHENVHGNLNCWPWV
jgi:hypothetical protein